MDKAFIKKGIIFKSLRKTLLKTLPAVSAVVQDIAVGAGSLGSNFWAGRIKRNVANGSPPLRRFFGAVFPRR